MTIQLPEDLQRYVHDQVRTGRFMSEDDVILDALKRHRQAQQPDAGLLSEIKPPITDPTPYQNRQAVPIQGEPLSETVLRERR
jgi:putative addiction module CopG family antidote